MKRLMYLLIQLINENCKHLSVHKNDLTDIIDIINEDNIKVLHAYVIDEMMYIQYKINKDDEEYAVENVSCNVERFLVTFEHILRNIAITDLEREDFNNIITELYLRIDDINKQYMVTYAIKGNYFNFLIDPFTITEDRDMSKYPLNKNGIYMEECLQDCFKEPGIIRINPIIENEHNLLLVFVLDTFPNNTKLMDINYIKHNINYIFSKIDSNIRINSIKKIGEQDYDI